MDDTLYLSYHKAQSGIRSVLYNVMEQEILDLLRKKVIGETLNAGIAKFFDTDAAPVRLSKKLLTSSSFMALITTFVRRKTDSAIADQKCRLAMASKKEAVPDLEAYDDIIETPPSRSDSGSEEPQHSRPSRRRSKNLHGKREDHCAKKQTSLSKS